MNNLVNALQIGTSYKTTGYSYCVDDNTYIPYTYHVQAWACPMRSRLPAPVIGEIWAEIFGG